MTQDQIIDELKAENERLKAENQSYFEITEMADNDYAMMQACEFAEFFWANVKERSVNGYYQNQRGAWVKPEELYQAFLQFQFKK